MSIYCLHGLSNESAVDAQGWARLSPYGEHVKLRQVRGAGGRIEDQRWVQVLDRPAAEAMAGAFNSMWGRMRRVISSVPVYAGHPDLAEVSPETVQHRQSPAVPVGSVNRLEARDDGLYAQMGLFPSGQTAVANAGLRFLSPLWWVTPEDTTGKEIRCRPVQLISVGLTDTPNIPGSAALDNHQSTPEGLTANQEGTAGSTRTTDTEMKHLLIGLLAAQGVALANDSTDDAVFRASNDLVKRLTDERSALANDKSTLTAKVTELESTLTAEKTARTQAETALGNEKAALANERKAHATALVDLAIAQGKIAVADRDSRISTLTGAQDFTAAAAALANESVKHRVAGGDQGERRGDAGATNADEASRKLLALCNEDVRAGRAQDFSSAWESSKASHPALHEAIAKKA